MSIPSRTSGQNENADAIPTWVRPSVLERHAAKALEAKSRDEAEGRARIIVCVTRCSRGKVRDERNLSFKYGIDKLVECGTLPEDDEETILEVLRQERVQDPKEVGTVVTLIWP